MKFKKINGEYDAIFSLGNKCIAGLQMKKFHLRPFSGVLDWVGSPSLVHVNKLLETRFAEYLDKDLLVPKEYLSETDMYVWNKKYQIAFNHDFKRDKNTLKHLGGYEEVKVKYDRRIKRFYETLDNPNNRILFIRTEGSLEDVKELERVLTSLVKGEFEILIINHKKMSGLREVNWPLTHVTVAEMPDDEVWNGNDQLWAEMLKNVSLRKK